MLIRDFRISDRAWGWGGARAESFGMTLSHDAQKVAHSFVGNGVIDGLEAASFVVCRRVRKKLHRGAQLLAHLFFVFGLSVRLNLPLFLLSC
ncbi:hypothetical protein BBI10_12270 [Pseudomonas graminis]|uniref:Uncharacterized protein n=1 Tax=Pseudomonas graminis TaxID=158627 RepID=A0A1C2E018_9PSED|nr:hypothetical protein BBI10_12270 [Pseudomonas graminis]